MSLYKVKIYNLQKAIFIHFSIVVLFSLMIFLAYYDIDFKGPIVKQLNYLLYLNFFLLVIGPIFMRKRYASFSLLVWRFLSSVMFFIYASVSFYVYGSYIFNSKLLFLMVPVLTLFITLVLVSRNVKKLLDDIDAVVKSRKITFDGEYFDLSSHYMIPMDDVVKESSWHVKAIPIFTPMTISLVAFLQKNHPLFMHGIWIFFACVFMIFSMLTLSVSINDILFLVGFVKKSRSDIDIC